MSDRLKGKYVFDKDLLDRLRTEVDWEDDEFDDYPDELNTDEISDALHLVRGGYIEPNIFNSSDWIKEISERYKNLEGTPTIVNHLLLNALAAGYEPRPLVPEADSNVLSGLSSVEELGWLQHYWNVMRSGEDKEWRELINDLPSPRHLTPLDTFVDGVMGGSYPTPEVILAIAKAFKLYFLAAGELSLEEVFFGRPSKRSGTQAMKSRKEQRFHFFHDTVIREEASNRSVKLKNLAETILYYEHLDNTGIPVGHYDVDTFLRGYRRWKRKNFPDK